MKKDSFVAKTLVEVAGSLVAAALTAGALAAFDKIRNHRDAKKAGANPVVIEEAVTGE